MPLLSAALLAGCSTVPQADGPVRYIDAHSHVLDHMSVEEELQLFRAHGVAGVVVMHPEAEVLDRFAAAGPGYVVPFVSLARLPEMPGLRLSSASAAQMSALHAAGRVCGFGEIPTRIMPRTEPTDDLSLLNPDRLRIYAEADRLGLPVNMHVDVATDAVAASISRVAREHPRARIVLAHTGWSASAEVIAGLMAAHPNLHADLSVRLDPAGGLPAAPLPPGSAPPGAVSVITMVGEDGHIRPEWRAVIERFPDRFLFAMDVTDTERPRHVATLMAVARKALGALGPEIENAVAHGNLERMLVGCDALAG